ncbi:hypothetical protein HanRHA438_Chr04g0182551 [Helianthus annuus]|nr:hypothetical protein HanRHA438_Chr04g0182551 [Helianthus annuus]
MALGFKGEVVSTPMISRSSGGMLAFLLGDAGLTPTWCRVRHSWAMIGDPGKPGFDP